MALLRKCLNDVRTRGLSREFFACALSEAPDMVIPPPHPCDRQRLQRLRPQGEAGTSDAALNPGANDAAGPFEWLLGRDPHAVAGLPDAQGHGERGRVSPALRQSAWAAA